jgi:hypothetical protein
MLVEGFSLEGFKEGYSKFAYLYIGILEDLLIEIDCFLS